MALPTSRNTTYAAGSQVQSVDLNAIQDQIVAAHTYDVAARSRTVLANSGWGNNAPTSTDWNYEITWVESLVNSPQAFRIPVQLDSGDLISTIEVVVEMTAGSAAGGGAVLRHVDSTTITSVAVSAAMVNATGLQTLTITANHTLIAGKAYDVEVNFPNVSADKKIRTVKVNYTRP